MPPSSSAPRRVLILKADRFYAHAIRRAAARTYPEAEFILAWRIQEASARLSDENVDLLLTGVEMTDGDVFELLIACTRPPAHAAHVLVITGRREPQVLATLGALPINGVFDPTTEEPESLSTALSTVMAGRLYWSDSILVERWRLEGLTGLACPQLTSEERLVLAVIGDGCCDAAAAQRLDLSIFTIQSVRRSLYAKLRIDNKGELVRRAAQLGFVLLTPHGVIKPGLSSMLAARQARQLARNADRRAETSAI